MENKKILLSLKNVVVKFHVRGRTLTAIRGVSLDIYENESIAIVGESGSGKSVLTKTFAGMLDSNGYIDSGSIILNDDELQDTVVKKTFFTNKIYSTVLKELNKNSKLEFGAITYKEILALKNDKKAKMDLSKNEHEVIDEEIYNLNYEYVETFNLKQTLDTKKEKDKINECNYKLKKLSYQIKELEDKKKILIKQHKKDLKANAEYLNEYNIKINELKSKYRQEINQEISSDTIKRNEKIAKEVCLSIGRYGNFQRNILCIKLNRALKKAMRFGVDLSNEDLLNQVFDTVAFRVAYLDENEKKFHGYCNLDLSKIKYTKDWQQIRGSRVATVFQDPMTSLNPIITIGKQITSIILKHQKCSIAEARIRAIELMKKVGITNAEKRFDDYPFQYSGGMRQRIVIAIALSCQPKILICDEPTTALDVTIQAQILDLFNDLKNKINGSIMLITHDLGVIAEMADYVIVMYAGRVIEQGTVNEIYSNPCHPYTQGLQKSKPTMNSSKDDLFNIPGNVPNPVNMPNYCYFKERCNKCLKKCNGEYPSMKQISPTHFVACHLFDDFIEKEEK